MQYSLKYRPKTIEDMVVGNPDVLVKAKAIANNSQAVLITGRSGTGKCVTGDTLVLTTKGYRRIDEIVKNEGYHVYKGGAKLINMYGEREDPSHTYMRKAKTLKIRTENKSEIGGTYIHPILVVDPTGHFVWKTLEAITKSDYVIQTGVGQSVDEPVKVRYQSTYSTRNGRSLLPFSKPEYLNGDVASILGIMVSEGHNKDSGVRFTNSDTSLLSDITEKVDSLCRNGVRLLPDTTPGVLRFEVRKSYNLKKYLEACGLVPDVSKHQEIPRSILISPKDIQIEYLRYYFEGDGSIGASGDEVSCCSASKTLILQTKYLLQTFGIYSTFRTRTGKYYELHIRGKYVDVFMKTIGFVSDRKNSRYSAKTRNPNHSVPPSFAARLRKAFKETGNGQRRDGLDHLYTIDLPKYQWGWSRLIKWVRRFMSEYVPTQDQYSVILDIMYMARINGNTSKVEKVIRTGVQWVYDFTLPRTHSFVTNGMISHNTTLAYIINNLVNGDKAKESLIEINCSEQRGIDSIRALQARLDYTPAGNKTVVLLDEVHSWTAQAASALLKIIENPPHKKILFLLATDQPYKLLGSIVNRCRQVDIELPSDKQLGQYVYRIAKRQKLDADEKELKTLSLRIARAANCVPRMAMQLLQDAVDLIVSGVTVGEVKAQVSRTEEVSLDRLVGSTLIALYSVALGKADADEAAIWLLKNMPTDAMGFLMRLQSSNYYAMTMLQDGKFDWRGKITKEALAAKNLKPSVRHMVEVTSALNDLRERLKEPATDPVILVGTGVSSLMYTISKK